MSSLKSPVPVKSSPNIDVKQSCIKVLPSNIARQVSDIALPNMIKSQDNLNPDEPMCADDSNHGTVMTSANCYARDNDNHGMHGIVMHVFQSVWQAVRDWRFV